MKILLFGGTFDPPHRGHMSLLRHALAAVSPERAFVTVAGTPPHKRASATPAALRLAMCACFEALSPAVSVSDVEITRGGASYTCDTVRHFAAEYPGAALYLCVGGDMLTSFRAWRSWRALLREVTLVAQSREGGDEETLRAAAESLAAEGGRILFAPGAVQKISSSDIRAGIARGEDMDFWLPPPAAEIVRQNGLYREEIS